MCGTVGVRWPPPQNVQKSIETCALPKKQATYLWYMSKVVICPHAWSPARGALADVLPGRVLSQLQPRPSPNFESRVPFLAVFEVSLTRRKRQTLQTHGRGSKIAAQNGTLVNGNMD